MKIKTARLVLLLVYAPWSTFLYYLVLQRIQATDLMWFLFVVGIPMSLLIGSLQAILDDD